MSETYREVKLNGRSSCIIDKDKYCYKKANGKCNFACEEKSQECPSRIQVADGKILSRTGQHNHMPNIVGFETKVAMSEMYHAAVMTDCPIRELIEQKFANLTMEVQAELPDAERMKTSLQAARRAAANKRNATAANNKAQEKPVRKRKAAAEKENKQPKKQTDDTSQRDVIIQPAKQESPEQPINMRRELFPCVPPVKKRKGAVKVKLIVKCDVDDDSDY